MTAASTLKGQIDENRVASVIVSRFGRMPLRAAEIGVLNESAQRSVLTGRAAAPTSVPSVPHRDRKPI